ncbi:FAD-dependent oxidoreductase [Halorubellus salinus]|uniref:FAD-dependent oxidoreductase n=1 Tax=Halorubellus salinus TaxID=755309 RepID=UPI002223A5DE|nr:FAD-dependent oxidoreductase [Halorubellus salinus]
MSDEHANGTNDGPETGTDAGTVDAATVDDTAVDVVVVGGGPAGSAATVFAARYGLETVVFDRGSSALRRCAYLENYLGFPGGVDVDVFHDLMHAHVAEMGARRVEENVDAVERLPRDEAADGGDASDVNADGGDASDVNADGGDASDDDARFRVRTQEGTTVLATEVVAAAWYDGSYLRPLAADADAYLFVEHEHHGEVEERFDPEYADEDGRTPIDGLYVASPSGARSAQAVVAAGNGAHVARSLVEDRRRARGLSGEVAPEYDWLRQDSEFSGEWADRDRWREWFENELADDHDLDDDELAELREDYVDEAFETRIDDAEADDRAEAGLATFVDVVGPERIADAVGVERIVDAVGVEAVLDAVDDGALRDRVATDESVTEASE